MGNGPLVSIVIPLYNSQNDILNCLKSISNQVYKNYEIIIVDDGSTDNSLNIVKDFKEKHPEILVKLFCQKNSGPSKARNVGIRESKGELIAFIDSDDEWRENKLNCIVPIFNNQEIALVASLYSIGEKEVFKNLDDSIEFISFNKLLLKNYFVTSGTVCRTSVLNHFRFNESQKYSEDYRFWLEICSHGYRSVLLYSSLTRMNAKPIYGSRGLSSKLYEMEKGELQNFMYLFKTHKINLFQVSMAVIFSLVKYCIRVINVKIKY